MQPKPSAFLVVCNGYGFMLNVLNFSVRGFLRLPTRITQSLLFCLASRPVVFIVIVIVVIIIIIIIIINIKDWTL
jgi:hypothetical protein